MKLYITIVLSIIAVSNARQPILRAEPLPLPKAVADHWNLLKGVDVERIVGGEDVQPGQRTFQIMLLLNGRFQCGGSWINSRTIFSAAHCVDGNSNPAAYTIRAATLDANSGVDIAVERVIRHPNYNSARISNDYAILITAAPLPAGNAASVVTLVPQGYTITSGDRVTVSGWGRTTGGGAVSQTLKQVTKNAITNDACNVRYGTINPVDNTMTCAEGPGQSACNGDSGGPLTNSAGLQYGCVSWGMSDCSSYPTVYCNVGAQREWIDANSFTG